MPVVAIGKSFVELHAEGTAKVHSASRLTSVVKRVKGVIKMGLLRGARRRGEDVGIGLRIDHGAANDEAACRYEPQFLSARPVPADPYAAWLQQREAEREIEIRSQVRWVHGQPAV
jgi:hypothetical protein